MKSLLSHKRNPENKIEKALEKIEKEKEEVNQEKKNDEVKEVKSILDEDNNEENNKALDKKRIKKIIKKNNKKKKEEKKIENQNKEKEEGNNKQKPTNKNISDYFNVSGKKEIIQSQIDNNADENKNINNIDINQMNQDQNSNNKEINSKDIFKIINNNINKDNIFSLENDNKTVYDNKYINDIENIPDKIKDFYSLNTNELKDKNEYLSKLKNYFKQYNFINNIGQYNNSNTQNKKIIYIHNSFAPIKKIPTQASHLINPKNYLAKDEYLIDYDKDSEDEFMEENAEDIKSNDNEDNEEDEEEDINSQQDDKFIVPDGHLSEEELSDKDIMEERQLLENSKEKLLDIMSIINVRKNFTKPVLIDFVHNRKNDEKNNLLLNKLTIGLFNYEDENINDNINMEIENNINKEDGNNINNENECKNNSFPIVIGSKVTKYKGIQDSIKIHFEDILRKVHGSYDTKEHLILELNKKFEDISKKTLNTFFKDKCYKIQKKYWMVNNETLGKFNIKVEDIEKIKKDNYNIYKEKEEKRKKELEEIKIKDGIIQPQNKDENKIDNDNINKSNDENKNEKEQNVDKNKNNKNNKEKKSKSKARSKSKGKNLNKEYIKKIDEILMRKNEENNNVKKEQNHIFNIKKVSETEKKRELLNDL